MIRDHELTEHIESLSKSVDWACGEIERLRAENIRLLAEITELQLKNENMRYWIRAVIQVEA